MCVYVNTAITCLPLFLAMLSRVPYLLSTYKIILLPLVCVLLLYAVLGVC